MTLQIPTLLALVGAALLAVAIFAPKRAAPLAAPAPVLSRAATAERRYPPLPPDGPELRAVLEPQAQAVPRWPELIDPCAARCQPATRIELIAALADAPGTWAESILLVAFEEESDPSVRAALERTLAPQRAEPYALGTA